MDAVSGLPLIAAIAAAVGGLLLVARRIAVTSGALLLATAVTVPFMQAPYPAGAVPLSLWLVLDGVAPAAAASAAVLWPISRSTAVDRVAVVVAVGSALIVGGLLPALLTGTTADGCNACAPNLLEVLPEAPLADLLSRIGAASALVWGPALMLVAARRVRAATPLARRHAWPVASGIGIAALAVASSLHGLSLPTGSVDPLQQQIWLIQAGLVVLLAAGALVRGYLVLTTGRRMAAVVLAAIPDHATVVGSLRIASADPGLDVVYVRPDGALIDSAGRPAAPESAPALRLSRDGAVFAEVRGAVDPGTTMPLLRPSVAAAGLAIEYLAAQARLRSELAAAAALRARIVETGGVERRRLERNLHDGAQQRLVTLGLLLTASSAALGVSLEREHADVDEALRQLRSIADGIFPVGLAESDLSASLRELGDHTACPLRVVGRVVEPVPLAVKMAAYELVGEVARGHPAGIELEVTLSGGGDTNARIGLAGVLLDPTALQPQLVHVEDRFIAAGGRLVLQSAPSGTMVLGEAPCGS